MSSPTPAIFAGYLVRCPLGGYAWQTVHYLRGLRAAGLDVWFYEDTRHHWQAYDPIARSSGAEYGSGVALAAEVLEWAGFADRWIFFDSVRDVWAGAGREAAGTLFADARLLINAAGVHRFASGERRGKVNVYIDMDPAYTQIRVASGDRTLAEILAEHDVHFSFGEHIGSARCRIPSAGIAWRPTRQPIDLGLWPETPVPADGPFTTIGTWDSAGRDVELDGEHYTWRKRDEWAKVMSLPAATGVPFVVAMEVREATDVAQLEGAGWTLRDPIEISRNTDLYRDFIVESRGEFTTAKDVNVRLASGWFSDRSACYLAAGRPVVTQDTGFADLFPVGEGLFAYRTLEEAEDAVRAIAADPQRHGRAARRIGVEHFAASRVVRELLAGL